MGSTAVAYLDLHGLLDVVMDGDPVAVLQAAARVRAALDRHCVAAARALHADRRLLADAGAASVASLMAEEGMAHRHGKAIDALAERMAAMPEVAAAFDEGRITADQARQLGEVSGLPGFAREEERLLAEVEHGSHRQARRALSEFRVHAGSGTGDDAERPSEIVLRRIGDRYLLKGDLHVVDGELVDRELRRCLRAGVGRHQRARTPRPVVTSAEPQPVDGHPEGCSCACAGVCMERHRCADDCGCCATCGFPCTCQGDPPLDDPDDEIDPELAWGQRCARAVVEAFRRSITLGERGAGSRPEVVVVAQVREGDAELADPRLEDGTALARAVFSRLVGRADLRRLLVDAEGEPLDLGRSTRTATEGQRRALAVRDGGCLGLWCGAPPYESDAHHRRHVAHGGPTDLVNLELRCPRCHRDAHAIGVTMSDLPRGAGRAFINPDGTLGRSRSLSASARRRLSRLADPVIAGASGPQPA